MPSRTIAAGLSGHPSINVAGAPWAETSDDVLLLSFMLRAADPFKPVRMAEYLCYIGLTDHCLSCIARNPRGIPMN